MFDSDSENTRSGDKAQERPEPHPHDGHPRTAQAHDLLEIRRALAVLFSPGVVVEIRALDVGGKTVAGYFDDHIKLAEAAAKLSGSAAGVYLVLNELTPALLARSANRLTIGPKNLTQDKDIVRRRYLPIDIDAKRPSGISSTDAEHDAALKVAGKVKEYLVGLGFPTDSIFVGDSGNGGHLLLRIDLPNDANNTNLIKNCIEALATQFDDAAVSIDPGVFNAARIWKLPGTLARKGDSTSDRPHRLATLLDVPATLVIAPIEALRALAATLPAEPKETPPTRPYHGPAHPFDLVAWMSAHDIEVKSSGPYRGGTRYILKQCVFNEDHTGTSVAIFQGADGRLGYKCQHAECVGKTWADVRELKEPGYKSRRDRLKLTDIGNAERLVAKSGKDIRFNVITKTWHVWNGKCWEPDIGEIRLRQLAKSAVRVIYAEAADELDDKQRDKIVAHAMGSESERAIAAMIRLAQAEKGIAITPDDFDWNLWLLNLPNGTLNLQTGVLQQHNRDDMLTRMAPVEYDPSAVSSEWQAFLERIFIGNTELIAYVKRALGYSITGDMGERALFFCYGRGANGKTQLLASARTVLGPYAGQTPPATFTIQKNRNLTGPNEAIAALHNVNLITATETEGAQRLAVSLLKQATGGEDLWHEKKWQHGFSFKPRFKLWLSGNYEPIITDNTDSIWDRLNKIPFHARIPKDEQIRDYGLQLAKDHGKAILAWLVAGCLDWHKQGLNTPSEVISATQAYRDSQDILKEFLTEECLLDPNVATITVTDLYKHYQTWCEETRSLCLGKITFNAKLRDRDLVTFRGARNRETWIGIRLLDEQEKLLVTSSTPGDTSIPKSIFNTRARDEVYGTEVTEVTSDEQTVPVTFTEKELLLVTSDKSSEVALGMPFEDAIEIWQSAGAPVIHLGLGENCLDLAKLLGQRDIKPEHLLAIKDWLEQHSK